MTIPHGVPIMKKQQFLCTIYFIMTVLLVVVVKCIFRSSHVYVQCNSRSQWQLCIFVTKKLVHRCIRYEKDNLF